jgi:hypothetical protein
MPEGTWLAANAANLITGDDLVIADLFGQMWTDFAKYSFATCY